jgi:16S rRNA processing protein RimM
MRGRVLVGAILGAHGIKGEVRLRSFTAEPAAIAGYNPLETTSGERLAIAKLRVRKGEFIAAFDGVTDRGRAEALAGTELFVPRARLPEAGPREVYLHDLVGLAVVLSGGTRLGTVSGTANYGAGDLLDVRREGREDSLLIPFAKSYLLARDADKIVVDLPEGFLD